ncbi:hypothetical protein AKO1_009847 [Acrasis kona]|uniref:Uncharacterized protein n=1 Tax=Acrasis kona TaxID=1008807 RepID=A0AAW2ZRJ7_9EUKA
MHDVLDEINKIYAKNFGMNAAHRNRNWTILAILFLILTAVLGVAWSSVALGVQHFFDNHTNWVFYYAYGVDAVLVLTAAFGASSITFSKNVNAKMFCTVSFSALIATCYILEVVRIMLNVYSATAATYEKGYKIPQLYCCLIFLLVCFVVFSTLCSRAYEQAKENIKVWKESRG